MRDRFSSQGCTHLCFPSSCLDNAVKTFRVLAGKRRGLIEVPLQALAQATGRQESRIKKEYAECGDLGSVASQARGMQKLMFKPQPLTLQGVFK